MMELQIFVAPLAALTIGVAAAWHFKWKTARHRERVRDLRESHKAMVAHYDAMDRIIASDAVDQPLKDLLMNVTRNLGDRDFARHVCAALTGKRKQRKENERFGKSLEIIKSEHPDLFTEMETVMASTMFVLMLRWPETSAKFKHFMVSSMLNEHREAVSFSKAAEIARQQGVARARTNDILQACAA